MSTKLYPPYIEGKISAQTGETLIVPFEMNRAVSSKDYSLIKAQIKTVSTNQIINIYDSVKIINNIAYFECGSDLQVGQFYKIQLAYVNTKNEIGYYSSVGVFKYTGQSSLKINHLVESEINSSLTVYEGTYSNIDSTEKEYSYQFDVYNDDVLVYSSGELIHNVENEIDRFVLPVTLEIGIRYNLVYTVTTTNNLQTSKSYYIMDRALSEIPTELEGTLKATLNQDEGYIAIDFIAKDNKVFVGQYRLLRFTNNGYEIIDNFIIHGPLSTVASAPTRLYRDFTIQQGVEYRYALQQFSDVAFSQKLYSNKVRADFEHMFLYDGERQLKIKFNPKVSSFKTTLLETKIDTIGSKYPFFFRNGNTEYKDFPISGLISMLSDENEFFYSWGETERQETRTLTPSFAQIASNNSTNLSANNLMLEREFKLEVLNWLNNGKPKLFRSATEGNYIVRLMNVSLSPNDTLGRMLHTFSAQAYEIMSNTFQNLLENKLISPVSDIKQMIVSQAELTAENNVLDNISTMLAAITAPVGTRVRFTFADANEIDIQVGNTQVYQVPAINGNPIIKISVLETAGSVIVDYDASTQSEYPLKFAGQEVSEIIYGELAAQFSEADVIIDETNNKLLKDEYQNFNIMSLTLTAKVVPDGETYHSDITLNTDAAGYTYTATGQLIRASRDDYTVTIGFAGQEPVVLNLQSITLYEDLQEAYPNRWRLDSFGNITLTCDIFDDNLFQPTVLILGNHVYANIYYSVAKYIYAE